MATVYILFSKSINKFYTGSCINLNDRIVHHQNKDFKKSYTGKATDWELYVEIDNLDYQQARKMEKHT